MIAGIGAIVLIAACSAQPTPIPPTTLPSTPVLSPTPPPTPTLVPFVAIGAQEQAAQLGRGVNFGNMLEAPTEGAWGLTMQEEYFDLVKEAGFQTVRLPVRWSAHAAQEPPYTIDERFFERVDWAIQNATARGLNIVVNIHHYDELLADPTKESARFAAIWKQIAERYKDYPSSVLFELFNEPHSMSDRAWNKLAAETLAVVRESNPTRNVVIGGTDFNSINGLLELELPEDDSHLIATFHYYLPFDFTHQGADWVPNSGPWLGNTWGTSNDKSYVAFDLDRAANWGTENNRPVWLGEFGAYHTADMDSRVAWTTYIARQAEKRNIHWAYWELAAGFGVYDRVQKEWIQPLLTSLIP